MNKEEYILDKTMNLEHDWDGEISNLHGEELWDLPNKKSRRIKRMVVEERIAEILRIKKLPFWKRLFNIF
jgi:hypothetical protein